MGCVLWTEVGRWEAEVWRREVGVGGEGGAVNGKGC